MVVRAAMVRLGVAARCFLNWPRLGFQNRSLVHPLIDKRFALELATVNRLIARLTIELLPPGGPAGEGEARGCGGTRQCARAYLCAARRGGIFTAKRSVVSPAIGPTWAGSRWAKAWSSAAWRWPAAWSPVAA